MNQKHPFLTTLIRSGAAWEALRRWQSANPDEVEITEDSIDFESDEAMLRCVEFMAARGVLK
jgi:hypothetical protein